MVHKGKQKGYQMPAVNSLAAQKVRAYRYMFRIHPTKKGCARMMKLSIHTVLRWWDACDMSDEDVARVNQVRDWMVDNRSANSMACAMALGRDPDAVKADMLIVMEWQE